MKKKLILLLAVCLLLSLCACGNSQSGDAPKPPEDSGEFGASAETSTVPTTQAPAGTSQTPEPSGSTGKVGETDESLSRTVSFDAGGGSGTMQAVSVQVNTEYVLPACTFTAPGGKVFQGWQAEKETEVRPAGGKLQITKDVTLKAVWTGRWAALQAEIANAKSGDVIKLSGDTAAEASDTGLVLNKPLTIDLCGFTLDRGKNGSVMEIQSGEVVITDSSTAQTGRITGGESSGAGGAIVVSGTAATLTINGGTITGNSAKTGGAIYNAGTVIMNGGSISGNTASENYGGAIFNQGKCTVNGGSITDNSCGGDGGALWSEKELVITGGAIRNNRAGQNGGGVYLYYGSLTVSGSPVIQDNSAGETGAANNIYLAAGVITVGGKLSENARMGVSSVTAPASGRPVVLTEKLSGNGIAANFFSDNSAYAVGINGTGEAAMVMASVSVTFSPGGGAGKMDAVDVELGSAYKLPECGFTPPEGKTFAGWQIDGTTYQKGDSVEIHADTTVTALWKDAPASPAPSPSAAASPSPSAAASPSPSAAASPSPSAAASPSPSAAASPSPSAAPASAKPSAAPASPAAPAAPSEAPAEASPAAPSAAPAEASPAAPSKAPEVSGAPVEPAREESAKPSPAEPSPVEPAREESAKPSPAEPSPEEPAEPSPEEPAEPSPEEPAEPSPEEPAEPSPEEPAEEPAEPSPEEPAEEPAEPSPEEPAEEPAEPSPEEPAPEEPAPEEPAPEEPAEPAPEASEAPAPATVEITFDAGGGTEKMEALSLEEGSQYKLPECKFTPPEGKVFAGWVIGKPGETSGGSDKPELHQKDETITLSGDTVLKAQWKDAKVEEQPSETGSVFGGSGGIAAALVAVFLAGAAAGAVVMKKKKS